MRDYCLKHRGPFWYFKLPHETCFHSTGRQDRGRAEQFAQARMLDAKRGGDGGVSLPEWISLNWNTLPGEDRRAVLFAFYRARCHYCGQVTTLRKWRDGKVRNRATIDHVVPLVAGGPDTFENCVLACSSCNSRKSAESYMAVYQEPAEGRHT